MLKKTYLEQVYLISFDDSLSNIGLIIVRYMRYLTIESQRIK